MPERIDESTWRARVESELAGADFGKTLVTRLAEGIDVRPLYSRESSPLGCSPDPAGFPGEAPCTRGGPGWMAGPLRGALFDEIDAGAVKRRMAAEVEGGVRVVTLRFDRAGRLGFDAGDENASEHVGKDGTAYGSAEDLRLAFEDTDPAHLVVRLDAGANAVPAAAAWLAMLEERGVDASRCRAHFGADPIGSLARDGWLPGSLRAAEQEAARLAGECVASYPNARALRVSTRPYELAGANAAEELGLAIATAVHVLRTLEQGHVSPAAAGGQFELELSVGRDTFLAIAKLRAARLLLTRVLRACGVEEPPAFWIHAEGSTRTLAARDPWTNLVRSTTQMFAAVVGGADSVSCPPFDAAIGRPDDAGIRLARNTTAILLEESRLADIADPAGGSWYVESLTEELARRAWTFVREIEAEGGMARATLRGFVRDRLARSREARRQAIRTRKLPIVGVSEFPDDADKLERSPQGGDENDRLAAAARVRSRREERASAPALPRKPALADCVQAMRAGATLGELSSALVRGDVEAMEALPAERDAALFESLRDAADRLARAGARPSVWLAALGPIPEVQARAEFARGAFAAAGFEVLVGDGTGDLDARSAARTLVDQRPPCDVTVLCGSDDRYASHAVQAARALADRGGSALLIAGRPRGLERELRSAGVEPLYAGMDLVEVLARRLSACSARSSTGRGGLGPGELPGDGGRES